MLFRSASGSGSAGVTRGEAWHDFDDWGTWQGYRHQGRDGALLRADRFAAPASPHGGELPRLWRGRTWPAVVHSPCPGSRLRSEEHTSELQSLMRISYAVFCLKKKKAL